MESGRADAIDVESLQGTNRSEVSGLDGGDGGVVESDVFLSVSAEAPRAEGVGAPVFGSVFSHVAHAGAEGLGGCARRRAAASPRSDPTDCRPRSPRRDNLKKRLSRRVRRAGPNPTSSPTRWIPDPGGDSQEG